MPTPLPEPEPELASAPAPTPAPAPAPAPAPFPLRAQGDPSAWWQAVKARTAALPLLGQRYSEALHPLLTVFFLIGLGLRHRRVRGREDAPLLLFPLLLTPILAGVSSVHGYLDVRHLFTLAALSLPYAGFGFVQIIEGLVRLRSAPARRLRMLSVTGLVLLLLPLALKPKDAHARPQRAAGDFLRGKLVTQGTVLHTRAARAVFYGGGRGVLLPDELEEALRITLRAPADCPRPDRAPQAEMLAGLGLLRDVRQLVWLGGAAEVDRLALLLAPIRVERQTLADGRQMALFTWP